MARITIIALAMLAACFSRDLRAGQVNAYDLGEWGRAVETHIPGDLDAAVNAIGRWSRQQLNALTADWIRLRQQWLNRRLDLTRRQQLSTLHVDDDAKMARFVKRAAMLHADIAMLMPKDEPSNPDRDRDPLVESAFLLGDGQHVGYRVVGPHWALGRELLDTLRPSPAQDEMARQWYIAAGAYMEFVHHFDDAMPHLVRAGQLFPDDAQILLLTGAIHEHYASPPIQSAIRTMAAQNQNVGNLIIERKPSVQAPLIELGRAEALYKEALRTDSSNAEIRLRLGRVLGLVGWHRQAIEMLMSAKTALRDPVLRYYACLFLGRERHHDKALDDAQSEFREASALFPAAATAHLALSQLASERGDRAEALAEMQAALAAARAGSEDSDPWTYYMFSHVRDLPARFRALYVLVPPPPSS